MKPLLGNFAGGMQNLAESGPLLRDAVQSGNLRVLASLLGPAFRGLVQQRGRNEESTPLRLGYSAQFDWRYKRNQPEMARLYEAAKAAQWNATTDLAWSTDVDPESAELPIIPDAIVPLANHPAFLRLTPRRSPKPCPGSTPSSSAAPRWSTKAATSRPSTPT